MVYSVDGESYYSDEVLDLACLLISYENDEPHIQLPNFEPDDEEWYPDISKEYVLEQLNRDHYGDCVNNPITCTRCQAEVAIHKAQWLISQNKFPK